MARGRKALSPAQQVGPDFVGATPADMAEQEARIRASVGPLLNETALVDLNKAPAQLMATQESMAQMLDLGRRLGQMETASFFSNICDEVLLSSFENAKKSKAWRLLKDDKNQIFESFDEFCRQRFGYSYARLQQVSGNRNVIGQDAFEQAERLGLRQRDYNAIKALPAPDQELVRRAVEESTTREQVLDLLQELAARHAKEREALQAENQQAKQDANFTGEQLQKERQRADLAERELRRGAPENRPLDAHLLDPFQSDIAARQALLEKTLMAHNEAITALDSWWTRRVTAAPAYDPMEAVDMPSEVLAVAQHLHDSIERTAAMVGALQQRMAMMFGDQVANARQHLLQMPNQVNDQALATVQRTLN